MSAASAGEPSVRAHTSVSMREFTRGKAYSCEELNFIGNAKEIAKCGKHRIQNKYWWGE